MFVLSHSDCDSQKKYITNDKQKKEKKTGIIII